MKITFSRTRVLRVQTPARLSPPPGALWVVGDAPLVVPPTDGLEGLGDLVMSVRERPEFVGSARAMAEMFPAFAGGFLINRAAEVAEIAVKLSSDLVAALKAGDRKDEVLIQRILETLSGLSSAIVSSASRMPGLTGALAITDGYPVTLEHTKQIESGVSLSVILCVTEIVEIV